MNTLASHSTEFIPGTEETCAKFTIDDPATPFVLHAITRANQEYTLGLWIKADADGTVTVNDHAIPVTTDWTRHVLTYVATGINLRLFFDAAGTYYIYRPKLEIGNVASDWTPNPNDDNPDTEFKLNMTGSGALFTKGSNNPLTVTEEGISTTNTKTGNITIDRNGEHRHGDWVWRQRGNGNYGLQWKEATE